MSVDHSHSDRHGVTLAAFEKLNERYADARIELDRLRFTLHAIAQHPSGTSRAGESMRRWAQRALEGLPPWEEADDDD